METSFFSLLFATFRFLFFFHLRDFSRSENVKKRRGKNVHTDDDDDDDDDDSLTFALPRSSILTHVLPHLVLLSSKQAAICRMRGWR